MQPNTFFSLDRVIDRLPLTVTTNTLLTEVISLMHERGSSCDLADYEDRTVGSNHSCVLVLKGDKPTLKGISAGVSFRTPSDNGMASQRLQGIFTERDLVKLVARGIEPQNVTVEELMSKKVITLTYTGEEDVFTALSLLKEHRIRHLPVVDSSQNLMGLITAKSLRQKLQPINLMKWRKVLEVMEQKVIHAAPDDSLRAVAVLMANRQISCVAICETQFDLEANNSVVRPIGIITERDIVQFQNLNIDLELPARNFMSEPLFLVSPEDSLWNVYQQMKQRRVRRLVVGGAKGELAGIITQSSLLQVFDSTEMYGAIELLQRQVCQLETEREKLLRERNSVLEQEVQERTAIIAAQNQELAFHIDNSPLAVVEWDNEFRIKRWSVRAEQMFGWQESEVLGKCWSDWQFVLEADVDNVTGITNRLLDGSEPRNVSNNRNYTKDGDVIDCEWHNSVLLDESGNSISILSLAQDVSARQAALRDRTLAQTQLHNRIAQQEAVAELGQFALCADNLADILDRAVYLVASTLKVEYSKVLKFLPDNTLLLQAGVGWQPGLVGIATLGIEESSQAGYTLRQSQPVIVDDLRTETRFSGPLLLLDHQVISGMSVMITDRERPFGVLGAHTTQHRAFNQDDINFLSAIANIIAQANERQRAETDLKASQERYTLAVNGSGSGIWDWNIVKNEVFYAPRWQEILGYTNAELPNTFEAWSDRLHPEESDRVLATLREHLEHRVPYNIKYRLHKQNGDYCWVEARGQAIWNESGQPIRMAGSITDISEQQAALSDRQRRENILKDIASGVSIEIGENFFHSLVEFLSKTLEVNFAFVSKLIGSQVRSVETLAVYGNGANIDNFVYLLANAPCGNVIEQGLCVYPKSVRQLFPNIPPLEVMEAESYAGMPVFDTAGKVLGLVAVVDSQPFTDIALIEEVLKIFASRATTELERQQAELALKQSEQKFKVIFDQSFQFIGLLEPNGNIIEANQTALDFVGLTAADVRGKPFWDTPWWSMSVDIQELIKQGIEQAAQGEFVRFEVEHPGTDNRVVTVDFSLTPIKDDTGKVVMLIPEGRDISKQKAALRDRQQAEADLQKSNQILQAISSIQTQYLAEAEPAMLFDGMLDRLLELTESEYGFIGEIFIAADGSPIMDESYMKFRGRPYLKTHAITNIAWNDETRAFYAENAPKGMEFHNLQTLFGAVIVTGEPVIANSPSDDPRRGGLPDGHPPLNAFLGVPFYKNSIMTGMVGIANKQGGYDEALVHYLRPFLDTCSRIIEAYKSDRQKQQAEQKISEQAALLDITTDAIMVRGLNNQLLFWNQGAEKLYGWTAEAIKDDAEELLYHRSSSKLTEIQQATIGQGKWQGELNQVTKAGKEIVVRSRWTLVKDAEGNPESFLIVNTDVTEQKELESQFLRTQRLESLGTLAGGIAHDLNNILAPILGFSKLLPLKLPNVDEQTKGFFKIMENNANRGTALVKQILTFSRGLEGERGIVQIRHLIAEIAQIIQETFPKSIELATNVPKNLWTVNADVNQLHQVLMNLSVNARDAMPEGGTLTIDAENTTVDAEYARLHLDAAVGSYVLITISDTGVGIPTKVIDRIFEPFFTTKEIGRGTGLGLSTAIGIVKSHGGFIDVMSDCRRSSQGTQFKVFLPASDTAESTPPAPEEIFQGNGELILVVDDEIAILEVTKATLETYNYQVITASDGIKAIATYAQNQEAIELVIMDIMMPVMDGVTAIRTLKQINPKLKIIAVSGLINRQEIVAELNEDVTAFLNKPYTNDDLLKTIHEIVSNQSLLT